MRLFTVNKPGNGENAAEHAIWQHVVQMSGSNVGKRYRSGSIAMDPLSHSLTFTAAKPCIWPWPGTTSSKNSTYAARSCSKVAESAVRWEHVQIRVYMKCYLWNLLKIWFVVSLVIRSQALKIYPIGRASISSREVPLKSLPHTCQPSGAKEAGAQRMSRGSGHHGECHVGTCTFAIDGRLTIELGGNLDYSRNRLMIGCLEATPSRAV
jgi:hypothetical protein